MSKQAAIDLLKQAYQFCHIGDISEYLKRLDEAKKILDTEKDCGTVYGEWVLVSSFCYITDINMLCAKFKEAAKYINGYSCVLPLHAQLFDEYYNPFAVINKMPGHTGENADKLTEAVSCFYRLTGGGKGTDLCYRAQLAHYRGEIEASKSLAMEAFEAAQANSQELIALCAAETLAQIAKHMSDEKLWRYSYGYIVGVSGGLRPASENCRKQAEAVLSILSLSLGVLKTLPKWIENDDYGAISAPWGYRIIGNKIGYGVLSNAYIAQLEYYSYKGEPVKALNIADKLQKIYGIDNLLTNAYLEFLRAGCFLQLGSLDEVKNALARGIKIIEADGLYLIAAEFEPAFGELLHEAAIKTNPETLPEINAIGKNFWSKLSAFREEIIKNSPQGFTKREAQIAPLIAAGKTTAEIAEALFISEHTAKHHISNILDKLNVSRRTQVTEALSSFQSVKAAHWTEKRGSK